MNRFTRDYALIRKNSWRTDALVESNDRKRLEKLRLELLDEGISCEIVASDLPRTPATETQ